MKCQKIKQKLSAYLDKQIPEREEKEIFVHLDRCPNCKEEFENLQKIEELLAVKEEIYPSVTFRQGLWEKIEKEKAKKWSFDFLVFPRLSPVAVSTAVILGILTAYSFLGIEKFKQEQIKRVELFALSLRNFTEIAPNSIEEVYFKVGWGGE